MQLTIIQEIVKAEKVYESTTRLRLKALARLRGMGVAFPDITARLLKEARKEGLYSSPEELREARAKKLDWTVRLYRFIDWIYKTYSDYDVLVPVKSSGRTKPKSTEVKVSAAKLTDTRVEKILAEPENVRIIAEALKENGVMVIQGGILTSKDAETLVEREDNVELLIKALEEQGYHVAAPVAQAV